MASHETMDPTVAEADRRVERAKASLRQRLQLLERRFVGVRDRFDLPAQIRRHPWPAVGIAVGLGMLAGWRGRSTTTRAISAERTFGGAALAAIGAIGFRVLRELALGQVGALARRMWVEHGGELRDADDGGDDGRFLPPDVLRRR
jgi:hypothetical protein